VRIKKGLLPLSLALVNFFLLATKIELADTTVLAAQEVAKAFHLSIAQPHVFKAQVKKARPLLAVNRTDKAPDHVMLRCVRQARASSGNSQRLERTRRLNARGIAV
jgi:hypothetical protein